MENLTVGDISKFLAFVVSLLTSIFYLNNIITKTINKTLEPLNKRIDELEMNYIKTDLVNFMSQAENNMVSKEQSMRAHELYDKYTKNGWNSYVHEKWEKLKEEGKI